MTTDGGGTAAQALVRWWTGADADGKFFSCSGALLAIAMVLTFVGAMVALGVGWRPWL